MNKIYIPIVIIVCLIIFFYAQTVQAPQKESPYEKIEITIGTTKISADIADTPELQSQGLSGRKGLRDGEGMFFIFEKSSNYSFWMKDMNFPIDIIWIDENYKIIDITHSLATSTYPNAVSPKIPARYVLEVPAGFSKKNNFMEGENVTLDRNK